MGDEAFRTTRDSLAERHCPACGEVLAVLASRHKVLGAWVPEWEFQPCRNPRCPLFEAVADGTSTQMTGKNGEIGRSPTTG